MRVDLKVAGVVLLAALGASEVSASEVSKFLHAVFDEQLNRPPSGVEMNYPSERRLWNCSSRRSTC